MMQISRIRAFFEEGMLHPGHTRNFKKSNRIKMLLLT